MVADQQVLQPHPQALALLPEDGELSGLQSVSLESTSEDIEESSRQSEDGDIYSTILSSTFVPSATQQMTEQETVRQSVQQRVSPASSGSTNSLLASQ